MRQCFEARGLSLLHWILWEPPGVPERFTLDLVADVTSALLWAGSRHERVQLDASDLFLLQVEHWARLQTKIISS